MRAELRDTAIREIGQAERIYPAEEWRTVDEFPHYEVSSLGRVRSLDRVIPYADGRDRPMKGRVRKAVLSTGSGYPCLYLSGAMRYIHRLVASAFIPNPDGKPQVNHIDGNRENNLVENLEWVDNSENNLHSYRALGRVAAWAGKKGERHPLSIPVIGTSLHDGSEIRYPAAASAEGDGFHGSAISRAINGKQRSHKGYTWRYERAR